MIFFIKNKLKYKVGLIVLKRKSISGIYINVDENILAYIIKRKNITDMYI